MSLFEIFLIIIIGVLFIGNFLAMLIFSTADSLEYIVDYIRTLFEGRNIFGYVLSSIIIGSMIPGTIIGLLFAIIRISLFWFWNLGKKKR